MRLLVAFTLIAGPALAADPVELPAPAGPRPLPTLKCVGASSYPVAAVLDRLTPAQRTALVAAQNVWRANLTHLAPAVVHLKLDELTCRWVEAQTQRVR